MKSLFVFLSFIFNIHGLWAQPISAAAVQRKQRSADLLTPELLAKRLTSSTQTDEEKVRSIFNWITDNIAYNNVVYQRSSRTIVNRYKSYELDDDTSATLLPLNERVAKQVLQRKVAVCDGYSRLFKVLCDYAGVRSEIIYGYARTAIGRIGRQFFSNHTWNAVYLNHTWHLLDVTWASGYISFGSEQFIKQLNENYYLTPPSLFIEDHYPEMIQWSLLEFPPTLKEFQHSPFKSQDFVKFKIQSFKPSTGIIEAVVGDTLVFELNTEEKDKKLFVSPNPYLELGILPQLNLSSFTSSLVIVNEGKVSYSYVINSPYIQQLNVVYNGRLILQYKVDIKVPVAIQSQ